MRQINRERYVYVCVYGHYAKKYNRNPSKQIKYIIQSQCMVNRYIVSVLAKDTTTTNNFASKQAKQSLNQSFCFNYYYCTGLIINISLNSSEKWSTTHHTQVISSFLPFVFLLHFTTTSIYIYHLFTGCVLRVQWVVNY